MVEPEKRKDGCMKKIYLICDCNKREKLIEKAKSPFCRAVGIVEELEKADMIFVAGAVTPEMTADIKAAGTSGIPMVKVNDNLVNEELFEKLLRGRVRTIEKGWERE